jgi:inhibitor of cysteine peptidase
LKGRVPVLLVVASVSLLAIALVACGSSGTTSTGNSSASPAPATSASAVAQTIKVDSAVMPAVVQLRVGDELKVLLHSNSASTGYVWTAEGLDQEAVLNQVGKAVVIPSKSNLVGAPGKTEFTFEAAEKGTEQLGFWYARPSDKGNPAAAYSLVVKVAKGHVPVVLKAGEDYTAETAEIRTGDTLTVVIKHASLQGKASWKMAGSAPMLRPAGGQKYSSSGGGTVTMNFTGVGTGTGTLVLVNRPSGNPPLETYSLPVYVKPVKQPITIQVNHHDADETFKLKVGDTVQVTLPAQPSTDYAWKFVKPNANMLQQVGKPQFTPNNDTMGSKGKMIWTYKAVGSGNVTMVANYNQVPAQAMPIKTFQFTLAIKPGFTPKTVEAVDSYPAPTVYLKPGDQVNVHLSAKAGTWVPQGTSNQLTHLKPVTSGSKTIVTYNAKDKGIVTPVILAEASGGWPNQAYAFSAVIGKGSLPKTVTAAERHVAKSVQIATGETFAVVLPGNPDSGYAWTVSPLAVDGVIQQVGEVSFVPNTDAMGSPGVFTAQFKGIGAGSVPLVMLYSDATGGNAVPDGIWMTMVTVQ